MELFLDLLEDRKLNLEPLITHRFPFEKVLDAYEIITGRKKERYLGILLEYKSDFETIKRKKIKLSVPEREAISRDKISLGVIGAGKFATATLFPAFKRLKRVRFRGLATATGISAKKVGKSLGFEYCTTDYHEILNDYDIDAVIIVTRHNLHARMVVEALQAGKHVFVEKPLAITEEELLEVKEAYEQSSSILMVGFNRRFAPLALKLKSFLGQFQEPKVMIYRVNAGYLPPDHWYHDPEVGGGRIIGEGCHFIDFMQFLTNAEPVEVYAVGLDSPREDRFSEDNIHISIKFNDGSIGILSYIACGDTSLFKERIEVFCADRSGILDDFKRLELYEGGRKKTYKSSQNKGHRNEIEEFIKAL